MHASTEPLDISHLERVGTATFRKPTPEDGFALNQLVAASPPLDPNSVYCNLLQCSHFSDTAIAATVNDELVGFVSGYRLPAEPNTLFIWQIVIAKAMRGQGFAKQMLHHLIAQLAADMPRFIETTITPNNQASWGLFRTLARELGAEVSSTVLFTGAGHLGGAHDDEHLLRIGPIPN